MSDQTSDFADDEISFRPYFEAVWRYRQVIGMAMAGAFVLFVIATTAVYVMMPKERLGSIGVRFTFIGAENNKYPNGTAFNASELVSGPVLTDVYAANDLQRYATFHDFQQSLFVLQTNPALQQLDYDFQSKLSDIKLTPVDRDKLESEFTQKRQALRDPEYALSIHRRERLTEMPDALIEKVLGDTVETWARQTDASTGAARPDIDVVSRDVFARAASNMDNFVVRVDILRTGAESVINALHELQKVPGARAVRTAENRSLSDELANVENILKFDVEPLMGMARLANENPQDRLVLSAYISNQLISHRLDYQAATGRAQSIQTSLREYMAQRGGRVDASAFGSAVPAQGSANPAIVPQLSESFIDRLMEMTSATETSEMEYRRDLTDRFIAASEEAAIAQREIGYYDDLLKQLSASSPIGNAAGAEIMARRLKGAVDSLNESVDRVQKLYEAISVQTLNPSRRLYTISQPFHLQTVSAVAWSRVVFTFLLFMAITVVAAIVGSLVDNSRRQRIERATPSVSDPRHAVPGPESSARV